MSSIKPIAYWLGVLGFICTLLPSVPSAHAASFVAVQNGNWNDPATWGGAIPTAADDVTIPNFKNVTIPAGLTVVRDEATTITGNGYLDIYGTLTNNQTLTMQGVLTNYATGVVNNAGTLTNSGEFLNLSAGTLTNTGTITNTGSFDNQGTITNNGIFNNDCGGSITGNAVAGNSVVYTCCNATAPSLNAPGHRTHTLDTTPTFSWTIISNAQSYRLMIYWEDRSFEYKKRVFVTSYTLEAGEALSPAKYLWRVRTKNLNCGTWTGWSARNTLFVDAN